MPQKEIILKKCFEVTYFTWWEVDRYDPNNSRSYAETYYANSAAHAKNFFIMENGDSLPDGIGYLQLKVRRKKSEDHLAREPHPMLSELTESQLRKMKHSVGFNEKDPINHTFYRNRYVVPADADMDDLVTKGLALKTKKLDLEFYYLTEEGINVIISLMPIKRHKQTLTTT